VKARGYRVHFVLSGRELLDRAPLVRPDVIVLDADLPDLDSIAVCRTLRQNRAPWDMPVIMITATPATKQQRVAALEAGAWGYVSIFLNPRAPRRSPPQPHTPRRSCRRAGGRAIAWGVSVKKSSRCSRLQPPLRAPKRWPSGCRA